MRMAANHTDSLRSAGAEDRARGGIRGEKKKGGLTTQQKTDMVERARARAEEKRKNLGNSVEDNMGGTKKKKKERGRSRNRADDDKKKRRGSQSAKPRGMGSDDDAGADDGGGSGSEGEGSGSDEEGGESKGSSSPNVRRAAAASAKRRGRSHDVARQPICMCRSTRPFTNGSAVVISLRECGPIGKPAIARRRLKRFRTR